MAENLFGNTTPATADASDAAPGLTLGTRIRFTEAGTVTGLRWRFPNTLPAAPVQWFLVRYNPAADDPAGSLGTGVFSAPIPGVYNTVDLPAPVAVAAGDEVIAEVWTPDRYTFSPGYFTAAVVSGSMVGPADEPASTPARRNGRFVSGATGAFPHSGNNAAGYHVDVVFERAAPTPDAENDIEAENRLPGTAKTTWDVAGAGDASIQGFATSMHVARGSALSVKVHSPLSAWTGKVYRLGHYGGTGAREVATITGAQTTQPAGTVDPTTGMASCSNWAVNGSWTPPANATPGLYVIKIARNDNPALASHVGPFVVYRADRKAPITVRLSDSTGQAYNHAGADPANPFDGKSLYGTGTAAAWTWSDAQRARAVSYDRPLVTRRHLPQTHFFNAEYPLVRFFERLGYDVDYLTCAQVDADPSLLLDRDAVVSSGHDEYWSPGMWDAATAARDHNATPSNLVVLSGNEAFWRINWASGRRSYACWKDTLDGAANPSGLYSGTWQDARPFNPDRRTAARLHGQRFRLNGIAALELGAAAAHATSPFWRNTPVAALVGAQTWTSPDHLVGFEADEPADLQPADSPFGLLRLSGITHQITAGLADDNGATYTGSGPYVHAMTAYRASSGAVVFAAGTVQYAWALDDVHDRHPGGSLLSPPLQQALTNLLADLGQVPPAYPFPVGLVRPTPVALTAYGFPVPPDTQPPAAPAGLAGTPGQTTVALTWTAATDNVGVTGYRIYRDGVEVAEVGAVTAYTATGLTAGASYEWQVAALDAAGHESARSAPLVLATTPPPPVTLDPTTAIGRVRLLITDTDPAAPLLTDQQLTALLELEGGNVKRGAAAALETIATSETLIGKKISTQDLSTDGPAVATALMKRAEALRAQADAEAGEVVDPYAYGFDSVDFPTVGTHPGVWW